MIYLAEYHENLGAIDGFSGPSTEPPAGYWDQHDYYFATSTRDQRVGTNEARMFQHRFSPVFSSQNTSGNTVDLWMRVGRPRPTQPLRQPLADPWREEETVSGCCGLRIGTRIETVEGLLAASRRWDLADWDEEGKILLVPLAGVFLQANHHPTRRGGVRTMVILPHLRNPRLKIGALRVLGDD